jgi:hypothetical protein
MRAGHKAFRLLIVALAVCFVGQATAQSTELVSMVQLIASPEKFDGKVVQVVGFLRLEHEGDVLYLHEDDYRHRIRKNGLWVARNKIIADNINRLNMNYVLLVGTFNAGNKGHMSLNSGAITDIVNAEVWSPSKEKTEPPPS